jgi:hypothetical protein
VASRPREIELSVERPLGPEGPAGGVARLTVRFELGPNGKEPSPSELAQALDGLKADLDALVGVPLAGAGIPRADRELAELVETYRPRQRELIDLLREEGQLTPGEHARLVEYLGTRPAEPAGAPAAPPDRFVDRPIAAVPIAADRSPEGVRPVAELLREYQIGSLRQAGAVRARRQISFAEYMALKRHFEDLEQRGNAAAGQAPG